jgi:ATP-binding cassette subfamily C protein LapB
MGFESNIRNKAFGFINEISLPLILITKNNGAIVLKAILNDDNYEIIGASGTNKIKRVSRKYLEDQYTGFCIEFIKKYSFDKRALELVLTEKPSWLSRTFQQYKKIYIQIAIATFLINVFALLYPLFVMNVYDRVIPNNSTYTLWALVIGISLIYLFDFTMKILRTFFIDITSKSNNLAVENEIFEKVIGMQMDYMPTSSGAFANSVKDVSHIREFYTSGMLTSVIDLPFVLIFLTFIALIAGPVVFVAILAFIFTVLVSFYFQAKMRHSVKMNMQGLAQKQAIIVESLNNLENIKGIGAEDRMQTLWKNYLEIENEHGHKTKFYSGTATNVIQYTQQMAQVLTVLWGAYKVLELNLTVGTLIACSILVGRVLAPVASLSNMLIRYEQVKQALFSIEKILNTPQEFDLNKQYIYKSEFKGDIVFDNVSFAYPGAKTLTLEDVSFSIKAGEKVGIVGYMGSGKTTILRLLMKLYEPTKGMIKLDSVDLNEIDAYNLRMYAGYVSQEPTLFFGTIRDNLLVGNVSVSDEKLAWAAEKAGLLDFIGKYPQGIGFPIGEGGAGLSFGQRQTVNITRCLLRDPKILLMDEPTSGMDNTSELHFIKRFKSLLKDQTFIVVTHRKSLLALVDRVIILHNGKIVQDADKNTVLNMIDGNK